MCTRNALVMLAAAAAVGLTACSTGGSVDIANSQAADTQTTDYAIAYVKRSIPTTTQGKTTVMAQDDLRLRRQYFASADLYLLNPTDAGGQEQNVTSCITSTAPKGTFYDVKDVDVSTDGTKIIFAMRGPVTAGNEKNNNFKAPNWDIWEYDVGAGSCAQNNPHMIAPTSDPTGTGAQYVSPHYLPDGRILFSTTRQFDAGAVLLNEGKPEFEEQTEDDTESSFVLHVMDADGTNLHQITFNQSHDIDATVLADGRIMFTRWDHADGNDGMHLYTANPDGTNQQLLYGQGSHTVATTNPGGQTACPNGEDCTVEFVRAREMPNGQVMTLVRPYTPADWGGNIEIINTQAYVENNQSAAPNSSASYSPYPTTTVAEQAGSQNEVLTAVAGNLPVISPGGRFTSAFPLWDGTGRILVTWSECRLQNTAGTILPCTSANIADTTLTAGPVLYSAWMFDPAANTFMPLITPTEGVFVTDIVALQPRTTQAYIGDSYDTTTNPLGILDIRSVYDWDGAACTGGATSCNVNAPSVAPPGGIAGMAQTVADLRPARWLRIEKAVSIPSKQTLNFDKNDSFGVAGNYMREILGYVPIEPDGSVRVSIPAFVAFQISVVDQNGRRIFPLHRSWLQLLPGQTLSCNGCHIPPASQTAAAGNSTYSHGRLQDPGAAPLFASIWPGSASAAPFPGTTSGLATCQGETMAEALVGYQCGATVSDAAAAATLNVNPVFNDPWFGGMPATAPGNESITNLSYTDPSFTTPVPTELACALPNGWNPDCRVIINYPTTTATMTAGNIQPLWDKCRMAGGAPCPTGTTTGTGTCSGCHDANTAATAYLDLVDGAAADNNNVDNSYQQLTTAFSVTTTNPITGQTVTNQVRGAEIASGSASGSNLIQVLENPNDSTHYGLLSPAELRMLSEWIDIGAQYYNNPFVAPLAN
jgi:hypothetical protein